MCYTVYSANSLRLKHSSLQTPVAVIFSHTTMTDMLKNVIMHTLSIQKRHVFFLEY